MQSSRRFACCRRRPASPVDGTLRVIIPPVLEAHGDHGHADGCAVDVADEGNHAAQSDDHPHAPPPGGRVLVLLSILPAQGREEVHISEGGPHPQGWLPAQQGGLWSSACCLPAGRGPAKGQARRLWMLCLAGSQLAPPTHAAWARQVQTYKQGAAQPKLEPLCAQSGQHSDPTGVDFVLKNERR